VRIVTSYVLNQGRLTELKVRRIYVGFSFSLLTLLIINFQKAFVTASEMNAEIS
jgi:hypothetical protein